MKRILVVDDITENRYLLEAMLQAYGYEVILANDGSEALTCARRQPPDLVVSDILMPVTDGFALCKQWRAEPALRGIPFIFYTATYTDARDEQLAMDLGADRFVIKPQEPQVMHLIIQEVFLRGTKRTTVAVESTPPADESATLREYNEVLVHKLAKKVSELEATRTALEDDITERKRANTELAASRERSEILSRQLIATQESERRHLARELHDEIGQALTGIKLNLKALQQPARAAKSETLVSETMDLVDQTLQQVRCLALDLRPSMLDDIGLVAAVRWCLDRQSQHAGFAASFVTDDMEIHVPPELAIACFRVAQESLTNISRHAQAGRVRVELHQRAAELELLVNDNGCGFDVVAARQSAARGRTLGVLGMEERVQLVGGRFEITSIPAGGTTIQARFPLLSSLKTTEEPA